MEKTKLTHCDNCANQFKNPRDACRFTHKLKETKKLNDNEAQDNIIGDVLKEMMFQYNPKASFTPLRQREYELRAICSSCMYKLRALYVAFHAFFPPPGTASYVRRKMEMTEDESFEVVADAEVEVVPVKETTIKTRKAPVITKAHARVIRKEIRKFAKKKKRPSAWKPLKKRWNAELEWIGWRVENDSTKCSSNNFGTRRKSWRRINSPHGISLGNFCELG